MRLATLRLENGTTAARIEGERAVRLGAPDVGSLLRIPGWRRLAEVAVGSVQDLSTVEYAPVVPHPGKIMCVGANYRTRLRELGMGVPQYPTLSGKFAESLVGACDDVVLPMVASELDWEAELAVVIGATVRHATPDAALAAIAGYAVLGGVAARDFQYRSTQWLQGKIFESTAPLGPVLVTPDEFDVQAELSCELDGEVVQRASTADLVFDPVTLVCYLSEILTLRPGDVIATGSPGGIARAREPARYLLPGTKVVTRIDGIGELVNQARAESWSVG